MRYLLPALALFSATFVTVPEAAAQSAPSVAVIDFQSAVLATAEFEKAYADLQTKYQPMMDQLQKAQGELADIETQLRAAAGQLSGAGQAELESRAIRKQREIERLSQDADEEFALERDQTLELVSVRMQEVLKSLAEQNGYDLLVDLSVAPYVSDALNVTQAAVDAYNAAYPVN